MEIRYDPFSPSFRENPYPAYQALRRSAPVYWAEQSEMWVISRYDDVVECLKDTERWSSDAMASVLTGSTRRSDGSMPPGAPRPSVVASDPPVHSVLRNIVNRGFTPRRIFAWKAEIEKTVDGCVASLKESRQFDVVQQVAIPVPVMVIAQVLGVEPERYVDFKRWATIITQGMNGSRRHLGFERSGAAAASIEMSEYLGVMIARRRTEHADDLLSVLLRASDGEVLTPREAIEFANLLLFAGTETTANLIGNAVHALLDHPQVFARMEKDPALIAAVVEETLRWAPPVHYLFRRATADVEIGGVRIPSDSIVAILIASANRDERVFGADAGEFRIDRRAESPHLAFGFGAHFCLGAALARLETMVALERLVPIVSRARRVTRRLQYIDSLQFRGLASLEMEWA